MHLSGRTELSYITAGDLSNPALLPVKRADQNSRWRLNWIARRLAHARPAGVAHFHATAVFGRAEAAGA
jgi:hypothetical protein